MSEMNYHALENLLEYADKNWIGDDRVLVALPELRQLLAKEKKLEEQVSELKGILADIMHRTTSIQLDANYIGEVIHEIIVERNQ